MSKHSTAFKHSVVEFHRRGEGSYREVVTRFGIDHSTVRKWVASYAAHGSAGLAKKFSHYDAAFKLSILQRVWEDGLSHREAAAIFNIRNAGSLSDWERRYECGGIEALVPRRRERPRSMPEPDMPPQSQASTGDDTKSREELLVLHPKRLIPGVRSQAFGKDATQTKDLLVFRANAEGTKR